eukprot:2302461-Pyramimonas_sp.AAC.1
MAAEAKGRGAGAAAGGHGGGGEGGGGSGAQIRRPKGGGQRFREKGGGCGKQTRRSPGDGRAEAGEARYMPPCLTPLAPTAGICPLVSHHRPPRRVYAPLSHTIGPHA